MTANPLVSIILPTYNREPYLREAVGSVLAQTYDQWELIVIDDGSTDGTRDYLESLGDPRVRPIWRSHGGNSALLRNVGARVATGRYIAFLDSDDVWLPAKLVRQVEALQAHSECGWIYTGRVCIDAEGREIVDRALQAWTPYEGWILDEVLSFGALIETSATMIDRRLFERVGMFNQRFDRCQDIDLWIKLAEASQVAVVTEPLIKKRLHSEDRGTDQLKVQAYMNRMFSDLIARTGSPAIRRLCRRQRIRVSLQIAGGYRRVGRHAEARTALRVAFPYAVWDVDWWGAALKTLVLPAIPHSLLTRYSRWRIRNVASRTGPMHGQT